MTHQTLVGVSKSIKVYEAHSTMAFINRLVALCCVFRYTILVSNALIQSTPQQLFRSRSTVTSTSSVTLLNAFHSNNKKTPNTNNINGNSDLFKTLELKDEALMQAQTAVSSLENALESAVTNLENMQQLLQNQVMQLEEELETTKLELSSTQSELDMTRSELERTQEELVQSREETNQLELALAESQLQASRVDELEVLVNQLKNNGNSNGNAFAGAQNLTPVKKDTTEKPWQIFTTNQKVIPVLNEWIQIKGTNEGEIQISGKVTNHPTIPDGDAIVTSPLVDGGKNAVERKIVTTLSGSKYRLGTAMTIPASDSKSQKITSSNNNNKKSPRQQLTKVRSSITIPDLSGNTLGNG